MKRRLTACALITLCSVLFAQAQLAPRKVFVVAGNESARIHAELVKTALAAPGAPGDPALVEDARVADVAVTVSATATGIVLACSPAGGKAFTLTYATALQPSDFAKAVRRDLVARLPAVAQKVTEIDTVTTVEEIVVTGAEGVDLVIETLPGATLTIPAMVESFRADDAGAIVVPGLPQRSSVIGTISLYGYVDLPFDEYVGTEGKNVTVALEKIPAWHLSFSEDILLLRASGEYALLPGSIEAYASVDTNIPYMIADGTNLPFIRPAIGAYFDLVNPKEFFRIQIGVGIFTAIDLFPTVRLSPYQTVGFELPIRILVGTPYVSGFVQLRSSSYYGPGFASEPLPSGYLYAWPSGSPWTPENNVAGADWYRSTFEVSAGFNFAL